MKKWVCTRLRLCLGRRELRRRSARSAAFRPASSVEQKGEMTWAAEHVVGVAKGAARRRSSTACARTSRASAPRSACIWRWRASRTARAIPEIGLYWEKAAYEEAEHAAKFAELLGEVVTDSTKKNLEMRVEAENGATAGKFELAEAGQAA